MKSPFVLVDDWGEEVALTKVTPSLLATMLREATFRSLERYVGRQKAQEDVSFSGRRACTEHIRRQLASDKKLTPQGRGAYLSVLCGAVMTYHKAAQGGYLVEDRCPLCGQRGDTLRHRIWECCHPEVAAARRAAAPAWLIDEVARRPRNQVLWTSGLMPHPGDVLPRPADAPTLDVDYYGDGEPPMRSDGRPKIEGAVYVDGSCTSHVITELKRASTAMVAMGEDGSARWRVRMPVPTPMPQTSQAAEYAALPLVQAYAANTNDAFNVASDCRNVVNSCNENPMRAVAATRTYGGIMKPILADTSWRANVTVRKVPAHVCPEGLPPGQSRTDAVGNQLADEAAKSALALHPAADPATQQEVEAMIKRSKLVVRTIAAVLPIFPPMPAAQRMQRRPVAREGAAIAGDGGHSWKYSSGYWRCEVCWLMTLRQDLDAATVHRKCQGPKAELEAAAIVRRGHRLGHIDGHMPVLFCVACGSYSARRAYGLGAECRGVPTKAGAQALSRIKRGLQPWRTRCDAGGERPRLGGSRAWEEHRAEYVDGQARATRRRRPARAAEDVTDAALRSHPAEEAAHVLGDHGRARDADEDDIYDVFGHGGNLEQPPTQERTSGGGGAGAARGDDATFADEDEAMSGDHLSNAEARGTAAAAASTVGAREGPGGQRSASFTAATATPPAALAVAAVAAGREAVLQWTGEHAREAQAERGKTAYGPPSGNAAPLEGVGEEVTKRRRLNPPHSAPSSLGVGPSIPGLALQPHDSNAPTGVERRRDGTDEPAAPSAAAPSGDAAAVRCRREQPQGGWCHLYPRARQSECSGTQTAANAAAAAAAADAAGVDERLGKGGDATSRRRDDDGTHPGTEATWDDRADAKRRRRGNTDSRGEESSVAAGLASEEDADDGRGRRPHEAARHPEARGHHRGGGHQGLHGPPWGDTCGLLPRDLRGADHLSTRLRPRLRGVRGGRDLVSTTSCAGWHVRHGVTDHISLPHDVSDSSSSWNEMADGAVGAGCLNAPATPSVPSCSRGGSSGSGDPWRPPAGTIVDRAGGPPRAEDATLLGRHRRAGEGALPPWMRPPGWMYLPHLGIGGGADIPSAGEDQSSDGPPAATRGVLDHANGGDEEGCTEAAAIQGRLQTPGARHRRTDMAMGSIRGRASAPGSARRGDGGSAALARHFACLDQERAEKRARCGDHSGQDGLPSAAQRMDALRRRLASRIAEGAKQGADAASHNVAQRDADGCHPLRRRGAPGPAAPEGAATAAAGTLPWGSAEMQGPSNEDVNIHHVHDVRAGGGGGAAAGGRPTPASAAAAAQHAWHTAVPTTPAP